ncbi:CRISPR-associated protein Cas7/Cse4/CasC [Escherichia coli]|nr:CRISPR-associated protein Cas7/Cse4/CasC [Escherichia coli]GDM71261.1 CRISPR-associated protein Cas7/Cse4/CasC [Escherichia coli]GDP81862.1 CRISPR-associated protein Cas7/Cse4/CasC [Escherichia coli]GDP90091.1 CRISPR-associated protein Cas7/Cse4/CasC [Escherichia coli]
MTTFIQLHLLTAYPAANLNRDDSGSPKTVILGGATRLRVSSQSLKRAWRTSELFEQALAGHIGVRSGRIAREAATILIEKGIEDKKAIEWAVEIADYLGKAKKDKKTTKNQKIRSLAPKLNSSSISARQNLTP